jgi:hypothetical protein
MTLTKAANLQVLQSRDNRIKSNKQWPDMP